MDTGDTGAGAFYVSYTKQDADKWKGTGQQRQEQWNFKYANQWGDNRLTAFYNTSRYDFEKLLA